ncbi:M28 family peptidase [Chitinophaga silvatica]|nr:M28 family peptidase [Chitinophaga silvatica]
MRVLVAICFFFFQISFARQNIVSAQDKDTLAGEYGRLITPGNLKKQLYTLASSEMEGRETATPGQEKAAAYIASQFAQMGLAPGANGKWLQHYPLYSDSLLHASITVNQQSYKWGRDFWVDIRAGKNQQLTANSVVYVSDGTEMDYLDQEVKGKVVMMKEASLRNREGSDLNSRITFAAARGASALLIISPQASRYSSLGEAKLRTSGIYQKNASSKELNIYYITPTIAIQILQLGKKDNLSDQKQAKEVTIPIHLTFEKRTTELHPSNVLGLLEGTDKKDEYVFVTAHYDHLGKNGRTIYFGADDDASGTSAVIEIAAAFAQAKKEGKGPRRSIVFMTVSGEEKGLLGSSYYTSNPIYPLSQTVTDLNIDMIGRIDPAHEKDSNYVYIIGDNRLSSELRTINEAANNEYTHLQLDYKYNDPEDPEAFYYRSDHYMFAQHGIPIIFYFNGTHADYHQPSDTPDKINYQLLSRRAQLVFYTAWKIANRDERLAVDGM